MPAIKTWESISARHAKQGAKSKRYLDSVTYVHLAAGIPSKSVKLQKACSGYRVQSLRKRTGPPVVKIARLIDATAGFWFSMRI